VRLNRAGELLKRILGETETGLHRIGLDAGKLNKLDGLRVGCSLAGGLFSAILLFADLYLSGSEQRPEAATECVSLGGTHEDISCCLAAWSFSRRSQTSLVSDS